MNVSEEKHDNKQTVANENTTMKKSNTNTDQRQDDEQSATKPDTERAFGKDWPYKGKEDTDSPDPEFDGTVLEGWHYSVDTPMGPIVYPLDEYELAFQMATGMQTQSLESDEHDHEHEDRISLIEFTEPTEVPVANV